MHVKPGGHQPFAGVRPGGARRAAASEESLAFALYSPRVRYDPRQPDPKHPSGLKALAGLGLHADPEAAAYFRAGEELIVFLHRARPKTMSGDQQPLHWMSGDQQPLLWASLYRSMKTYRATLILCDSGFGEQAGMLCRSLFEDLLVTHWIRRTPGPEVWKRFLDHADRVSLANREVAEKHEWSDLALLSALSDERTAELEATGGSKGSFRMWHGQKLSKLLKALEEEVSDEEAALLAQMHDLSYRLQNLQLHHSPRAFEFIVSASIAAGVVTPKLAQEHGLPEEFSKGVASLSSRPTPGYVEAALRSAFFSVSRQARACVEGAARDELESLIERTRSLIVVLPPDTEPVGRNDPCPCGSGLKYKRCHGA